MLMAASAPVKPQLKFNGTPTQKGREARFYARSGLFLYQTWDIGSAQLDDRIMESSFTVSHWPLTMPAASLALGLTVVLLATGNGQSQQAVTNSKQSHFWLGGLKSITLEFKKLLDLYFMLLVLSGLIRDFCYHPSADCSCLHLSERNATQWGRLAINASHSLGAKNNCLMIFIAGMDDELVAFQLEQLQLRAG